MFVSLFSADTDACPDEYHYYSHVSCFRFFDTLVNHGTAVQFCHQQNAALIKIDSYDKQEHVNQYLGMVIRMNKHMTFFVE